MRIIQLAGFNSAYQNPAQQAATQAAQQAAVRQQASSQNAQQPTFLLDDGRKVPITWEQANEIMAASQVLVNRTDLTQAQKEALKQQLKEHFINKFGLGTSASAEPQNIAPTSSMMDDDDNNGYPEFTGPPTEEAVSAYEAQAKKQAQAEINQTMDEAHKEMIKSMAGAIKSAEDAGSPSQYIQNMKNQYNAVLKQQGVNYQFK
jgi:hypothetical protein